MSYITNQTFSVMISNRQRVEYQIATKENDTGTLILSINFGETSKISLGEDPDSLEVTLCEKIIIDTANQIVIFSKGLRSKKIIPPLLQESKDLIVHILDLKFVAQGLKGGRLSILPKFASNIFMYTFFTLTL